MGGNEGVGQVVDGKEISEDGDGGNGRDVDDNGVEVSSGNWEDDVDGGNGGDGKVGGCGWRW